MELVPIAATGQWISLPSSTVPAIRELVAVITVTGPVEDCVSRYGPRYSMLPATIGDAMSRSWVTKAPKH